MSSAGEVRVAGVIGWPVRHSLSPRLHSFWLREYGISGVYVPLPVRTTALSITLAGLRQAGFVGANVTLPHKEAAFALAHRADDAACAAGAANLLVFRDDGIWARNTDIAGLQASLVEANGPDAFRRKRVVILGAGGAARAAVLACDALKAAEIHILNRTARRAEDLAHSLSAKVSATLNAGRLDTWSELAPATALLIQATSAGINGTPALDPDLRLLASEAIVCDLGYHAVVTPLLAQARDLGLRSIDGLGMLMHQAIPAFEAFYGCRPHITAALRTDLERALRE